MKGVKWVEFDGLLNTSVHIYELDHCVYMKLIQTLHVDNDAQISVFDSLFM